MNNIDKTLNKKASLILGSYLDTLGFNNGKWEFNFGVKKLDTLQKGSIMTTEIILNYLFLGGENIDISEWNASDDTILMIATKKACKRGGSKQDYIDEYLKVLPLLKEEEKRGTGYTTIKSLNSLRTGQKIEYSKSMGGNGPASRTAYIGLHHHNDIDKVIKQSIMSGRLTHNHPIGFLGGLVTALFCAYAMNDINPFEWSLKLIELYESGKIDDYMKKTSIYEQYKNDSTIFWDLWYQFNDERLKGYQYKTRQYTFNSSRLAELDKYMIAVEYSHDYSNFGGSGIGAVIYSYDSLLSCYNFETKEYNFELMKTLSTLYFGDNDTTGAITGCWFGAITGFKYFNKSIKEMLEFKNEL